MSHDCRVPDVPFRFTVCPNGCVHLHYGNVMLLLSRDTLRALGVVAQQFSAALDERDARERGGSHRPN